VVVVGLPYDRGSPAGYAGCAAAPQLVRTLSSPESLKVRNGSLIDIASSRPLFLGSVLSDLGDLKFTPSQDDAAYGDFVSNAIYLLAQEGKVPLGIGGDHVVTLLSLRGLRRSGKKLQLVQLDAHHDSDAVAAGERPTHSSFITFVAAEGLVEKVIQVGVRGLSNGSALLPSIVQSVALDRLKDALLPGVDVYLSVDTDAFDPSIAPAVHFPEPSGLLFSALAEVLCILKDAGLKGVGADWTEYNPQLDTRNFITGRHVVNGLARTIQFLSC
jgi:agmatinase